MHWQTTRFRIDLAQPRVMGIVNVTPDSFSDGGRYASTPRGAGALRAAAGRGRRHPRHRRRVEPARARCRSTLEEELARVLPVLRDAVTLGCPVSVDTYKPEVMRAALDLGRRHRQRHLGAARSPARSRPWRRIRDCGVCLMHMHGEPQIDAASTDVRRRRRRGRARSCASGSTRCASGRGRERIVARPGHRLRQDRRSRTSRCWRASTNCCALG